MVILVFNMLQNDVEPLPEPLRTISLILILLGVVIIPLSTCVISLIRRRRTKIRVEELGASWDEIDAKVIKQGGSSIEGLECCAIVLLLLFAGIAFVLMQIFGSIVRDVAILILLIVVILLVIVICPIGMIWAVKIDDRKNSERIRLATEFRDMKEAGQNKKYENNDSL
jgi:hypothetical protein